MNALRPHLDSLRTVKSSDTVVVKYLITLRARSDSLQDLLKLPLQTVEATQIQQKATKELDRLPTEVNEKLQRFSEQGANVAQMPGFGLHGVELPTTTNASIPGVSGPSISLPGSMPTELPGATLPTSGLPGVPQTSLPELNAPTAPAIPDINSEVSKIGEVTKPLGEVTAAGRQVGEVGRELKTVSSGNLDSLDSKSLESKLAAIDDVADAGGELAEANRQAEMVKKWNSDPMYQRELAVTMAKEQAVNHFSGRESELLAVMEQLSKAKGKVKDVEQVVDLFAKPTNPMKDKPFIERLRPGVNLQLQWNQIVLLDINPYVGYRISGRWTAGIGWNERLGFSSDNYSFSSRDRIYGPRTFVHFKIKESNFLILSPELMHTAVATHTVATGESTSKWVPGLMAGYRKEFHYSKKVIGTVQFLYNLVAPAGQSAYASRFNLLFGFEFPLKRKLKQA